MHRDIKKQFIKFFSRKTRAFSLFTTKFYADNLQANFTPRSASFFQFFSYQDKQTFRKKTVSVKLNTIVKGNVVKVTSLNSCLSMYKYLFLYYLDHFQ